MPLPYLAHPMTLYEFNTLPYERQLVAVFDTADYLATRWEEDYERATTQLERLKKLGSLL